ncbi:MAG: phosphotyrosine protein phosphatase [Lewinellaceae bacterium]|nr:phosphotyrosine protein phosphatase [Lewinellaceae bacterium]
MRILFVCTVNKYRSKTAEKVFGDYEQYETKSAGIDKEAVVQLNQELLDWADLIVVMEKRHRNWLGKKFREAYKTKPVKCLEIPDEYDYMQPELVSELKQKMSKYIKV